MAICVCEYCGKAFSDASGTKLCTDCSKLVEEAYVKARRYIYQNPKTSDFASIIEATGISEKALTLLINSDRILVNGRTAGGGVRRCRACGKDVSSGALCDQCAAKIMSEKLSPKNQTAAKPDTRSTTGKKTVVPISFSDD